MGVLSTVSTNNEPWGSAIYFYADEDFNIFFVTRAKTLKYRNIQNNPNVSLTVADHDSQTTVQIAGKVSNAPLKDTMDIVFKKLASIKPKGDINWVPPIIKVHEGDWMILQLNPEHIQFANFKESKTDIHDEYIATIIPNNT